MLASICGSRSQKHGNKIAGRSSDSSLAFKQIFNDYGGIWEESRWKVTQQLSEVRRPSADCQSTFSRRFKPIEIFLKKVAERSRNSGQRSRDHRPTVKQRFLDVSSNLGKFWKKVAERSRDSGRRSRDRRPTVKQRFWTFQAIRKFFEKSRWTVTRQLSEVTRPSADCQTTFLDVSSN